MSNRTEASATREQMVSSNHKAPAKARTCMERIAEFNDPQRALGAGISSYHQQLVHLFFLFAVLLLMHVKNMTIFREYSFYDG